MIDELKYDDYNEAIYDKTNFIIYKIKDVKLNDIVYLKNDICKVTNIVIRGGTKKTGIKTYLVEGIGVFNNTNCTNLLCDGCDILYPIINKLEYTVISISKSLVELFNETTNEIIEINLKNIENSNIENEIKNDNIVQVIKFKNLIKIIEIIKNK